MITIGQIALTALILVIALWRRDIFFYFVAAPVVLVFGLTWRQANPAPEGVTTALVLIGIGLYCFVMGIYNLVRKGQ